MADIAPVADRSLAYLTGKLAAPAKIAGDLPADVGDSWRVLFVNGRLAADQELPDVPGLALVALADAEDASRHRIIDRIGSLNSDPAADLAALNAAFLSGGLLIDVAPGARIEKPLEVLMPALGRVGVPVIGIASNPGHFCARTRVCQEILQADTASEELLLALEREAGRFPEPPVLFPCTDNSVPLLSATSPISSRGDSGAPASV